MQKIHTAIFLSFTAVSAIAGSGSGSGSAGHNPTPAGSAEIAISSSTVPAGGTVQVRFSLTEPEPISSTGTHFSIDAFAANGISLWSPNGDACGAGIIRDGVLQFTAIDPSGTLGTVTDYPFLTVSLTAPQAVKTGSSFLFNWSPDSWLSTLAGPLTLITKPGTVTVGGSIFISGVYPGGGAWPAGTLVRVLGSGFQKNARVQTPVKYSSIAINPGEIDLYLKEQTTLDSQMFQVVNPDGSNATYFSYLKGQLIQPPSAPLLQGAEIAFPLQTHAVATFGPAQTLQDGQWMGLALQNPNPGPVVVTLQVSSQPSGTGLSILLPSGTRVADSLSALFNGTTIQPGDTVRLTSTAMIQIMGLNGDDRAQTLIPFVPLF